MKQARVDKYYEAILQIRNVGKETIDFIEESIRKESSKGIYVAKRIQTKNGFDYYLSSKKFAQTLGKKLVETFGGVLKASPRLFGLRDGKKVHRLTILFRGLGFSRGDIIKFDDKILEVKKIGKNIIGINLKNWIRTSIALKYLINKKPEKLEIKKAIVSKRYPQLEIIHPEAFQSVKIENPKKTKKDVINVFFVGEKAYMMEKQL